MEAKVPRLELSLPGTFAPWNFRSLELPFPGTFDNMSQSNMELLLHNTNLLVIYTSTKFPIIVQRGCSKSELRILRFYASGIHKAAYTCTCIYLVPCLVPWTSKWLFKFNIIKCGIMTVGRGASPTPMCYRYVVIMGARRHGQGGGICPPPPEM